MVLITHDFSGKISNLLIFGYFVQGNNNFDYIANFSLNNNAVLIFYKNISM